MTFTKNETVPKLLEVVKETISDVENKKFAQEEFEGILAVTSLGTFHLRLKEIQVL